MCICCVVGGVWWVILETRQKAGKNPLPGGAKVVMGAFLILVGYNDAVGMVCDVDI
jgi:hypothetical protein